MTIPTPCSARPTPRASQVERRRSPRARLETRIDFSSESNFYTGWTRDISEGGVFIETYDLRPVGTPVDLHLELPTGIEIEARGTVRWLRDPINLGEETSPGMGVEFEALDEHARALIAEFVGLREPTFHVI